MISKPIFRWLVRLGFSLALVLLAVILGFGAYLSGQPLEPWHVLVPDEPDAAAIDELAWRDWVSAEAALFASVEEGLAEQLSPEDRTRPNRYLAGSPMNAGNFDRNWNRSFVLMPEGERRGAAVFVHGLSDAPYSLRHVAEAYRDRGFVAVGVRVPGHGTVPAALTAVGWPDWLAAVRLAVREATRLGGRDRPFHLVGYSNGGALVLKFVLDALDDPGLRVPSQVVLLSPMIGVSSSARFAGVISWPAWIPGLARAAWLETLPEYNPFKYNSFPNRAVLEAHRLTVAVREAVDAADRSGALSELPPLLTFQSLADSTVSAASVVHDLYDRLPSNGSALVLYDLNRAAGVGRLFDEDAIAAAEEAIAAASSGRFDLTVIRNAGPHDLRAVAVERPAGGSTETRAPLDESFPPDLYSLSHVALPFPRDDGLYGDDPDPEEDFGIRLGNIVARGERGVLLVDRACLLRATFNPFFDDMLARILRTTEQE